MIRRERQWGRKREQSGGTFLDTECRSRRWSQLRDKRNHISAQPKPALPTWWYLESDQTVTIKREQTPPFLQRRPTTVARIYTPNEMIHIFTYYNVLQNQAIQTNISVINCSKLLQNMVIHKINCLWIRDIYMQRKCYRNWTTIRRRLFCHLLTSVKYFVYIINGKRTYLNFTRHNININGHGLFSS